LDRPFSAYEGDEPYVFVCYAHDDAKTVYPELLWLKNHGINVWYDEGISPGAEFPEKLGNAILGASLVLFYVSPTSVNSRHCRDEVYFGIDKTTPILALHIAETELPPGLALSTGTTQALMRHQMQPGDYRKKLLKGIALLIDSESGVDFAAMAAEPPGLLSHLSRYAIPLSVVVTLVIVVFASIEIKQYFDHQADVQWVNQELLPEIRNQMEVSWRDTTETYALALQAEEIIPDDTGLEEVFERVSLRIEINSDPPGSDVYMKNYLNPEQPWTYMGVTPIENKRVPVGIFRWKFEKDGYETVLAAASSWDISFNGKLTAKDLMTPNNIYRKLDKKGEAPPGTVRVAGAQTPLGEVQDFFIDRFEVTNGEFQKFIADGGYHNKDYWQHDFIEEGKVIGWEEGISRFIDTSGRPGPSSWLGGTYPNGKSNYPVSGVSWYEATAYAEYVGKSLPTGTHWGIARGEYSPLIQYPQLGGFALFAPFSNFAGEGTVEVGSLSGITAYGTYDLAGNVREWCSNDAAIGKLVRGGSFDDNPYQFAELSRAPAMFRNQGYGFRTVVYPPDTDISQDVFATASIKPAMDLYNHEVVSDEIFEVFSRQFDYDDSDLNVRQESLDDSSDLWTVERVSIDTAYGGERMIINMFLPKNSTPPYQTVIYFPGSASLFKATSENIDTYYEYPVFLSYLVKTGRAVAYPVYKGTFERREDRLLAIHYGADTHQYTEFLTQLGKDFRRTVDYLETRPDINAERLAFYGMSWGAVMGAIIPAIETRIKTAITLAGGISGAGLPEANPIHYLPRITMPYLMMVGKYDSIFDHVSSAKPLFELIGTPEEHKDFKVYETDHIPPKSEYIKETLAWLDRYLGPVGQNDQ
jgi:formylglycine-generating enzyme required for sulfatase activity/dienelactone hydrolase